MVMAIKSTNTENEDNQKEKSNSKEEDIDWEVNLEQELLSALEEIDRLKGKNKNTKEKLHKYEKKDHDLDQTKKQLSP
jgi:hypothetical protein